MRRWYLILFAMALAVIVYGQSSVSLQLHRGPLGDFPTASSKKTGAFDCEWQKLTTTSTLDSFFTAFMSTYHLPGLAACIVKKNAIMWQGYYGYSNISQNKPVTDSTIFMLSSISKTIMVTALMQLHQESKFKLDDSINAYLPFRVRNPLFPGIPITFQMLLTHTSSIQDNWNVMPYFVGDAPTPLGTYLHDYFVPGGQYYYPSLNFYGYAPGSIWNYSNIGAALAGYLVEVLSGVPFDRYCRDSVFTPLHMSKTAWFLRDLDTSLIARPYTYSSGNYIDNGLYGFPDYPDGQLRTTAVSLARFLTANIRGGELEGKRILDTATIRMIRTIYVPAVSYAPDAHQGLIWFRRTAINGRVLWGYTGGDLGVGTAMYLSESDSTGAIMLTNGDHCDREAGIRALMSAAETLVGVQSTFAGIPERSELHQNYPNPFNPNTTLRYSLPHKSQVLLTVFNTLGQQVATLVQGQQDAGSYEVKFDGSALASGVYFYRLQTGSFVDTKKLLLLK
jgi:CubicO group peptidase (beta-lactamase class C family)